MTNFTLDHEELSDSNVVYVYSPDFNNGESYRFELDQKKFASWLLDEQIIGDVTVDRLDSLGDHHDNTNDITYDEYMEECFDGSDLIRFINETNYITNQNQVSC